MGESILSFLKRNKEMQINIIDTIDVDKYSWCNDAILFEVSNGKGALRLNFKPVEDNYYGGRYYNELVINDIPILQASKPTCPTCAGLLAVGYGIENADCTELKEISDKINAQYIGLENAFEVITPLLGLLQDGIYVLADSNVFPSDGNGHFFWDVPNELTENPTTACILTEEYECVSGIPAFLYPSQGTDRFDPERVEYYKKLISDKEHFPRAIAYFSDNLSSILLDGHHKAAACASVGADLPCLVVMPCDGVGYRQTKAKKMVKDKFLFGCIEIAYSKRFEKYSDISVNRTQTDIEIKNYGIIKRDWEKEYWESYKKYPDVFEYAEGMALNIPQITPELIENCFDNPNEENLRILRNAIQFLVRNDKEWGFKLALRAAHLKFDPKVRLAAFKALAQFKDNDEVEQFFINHLIEDNDPYSAFKRIADCYWD